MTCLMIRYTTWDMRESLWYSDREGKPKHFPASATKGGMRENATGSKSVYCSIIIECRQASTDQTGGSLSETQLEAALRI